jgi:hypothetical protein
VSAYGNGVPQSPAEIEAMIEERRDRLAATVDELVARTQPKALARRSLEGLRSAAHAAVWAETGRLRTQRLAIAGGSAVAVVAVMIVVHRGKARRRARR